MADLIACKSEVSIRNDLIHSLTRTSPSLIAHVDDSGARIIYATPVLEDLFGYIEGELDGKNIDVLIPVRFHENHKKHLDWYSSKLRSPQMARGKLILIGVTKDGEEIPVEIILYPQIIDSVLYVTATVMPMRGCSGTSPQA